MTHEVLIIGGGLLGCAAAWHLARAGLAPRLIEARGINAGASGQNAGSLHFQIERRFLEPGGTAHAQGGDIVRLNRLAIEEWAGLEDQLGRPLDIHMHGGLMLAENEADLALLSLKVARENELGLPTQLLSGTEARDLVPRLAPHIAGAAWLAKEGHANPRILADAFADAARASGAVIETNSRLLDLRRDGDHWQATIEQSGQITTARARHVILATGHWTARIAARMGLNIPLYLAPLMMSVTDRTAPFLPYLIQHVGKRLSMKQTDDGNMVIGGGWASAPQKMADGLPDLDAPPHLVPGNLRANLAVAAGVLPCLRGRSLIRSWTGMTCISADQLPIVGEVPAAPGLHVAAGGSMFTLGPLLARMLARSIIERAMPEEIALFSAARFAHLNAFVVPS
ncbi:MULTISPECIES: NAD(P)/FAD-dependent oxidoreductase [unclassified Novosphingobium]|uniref:NAD(P)/FAD-dependent oxidoreductase n=1 Tax=unclassified Novosphingobium TaxID=2644732 RepID=UPI00086D9918|nr:MULTISPECIES: FAD-dependent oxidoreductase [unclassified Novosphingobium]MDR6708642.1 glycine/D-amino acid oxidase-like deaminating enzyme [Novosphingobium sp. 1748]ODU82003.1 MAG: FAD-dependent oxidoreductase [Novosphingobium sp. SCN 63-17]OJX96726.1 MAG: FAD-dependent oxidoreductase [Novosphingobium sp. 63-713]